MDGLPYGDEKRRSHAPAMNANSLPLEIRGMLQTMMQNNEALISQNAALLSLLSGSNSIPAFASNNSSSQATQQQFSYEQLTDDERWSPILNTSSSTAPEFAESYFDWPRPPTLAAMLSERRTWTSWSYRASFPHLAKLLAKASLGGRQGRCPCQVVVEDYDADGGDVRTVILEKASRRVEELWKGVMQRKRPTTVTGGNGKRMSARLWSVFDLSPIVLACLLGSTPQVDLSYLAAFTERHLKFSNWGKVSLVKFRDMTWSSYTFEYHFSFFYVTPDAHERDARKLDRRELRRSAPFGREQATKTRYIHEECLSFLLIGHFNDISTCIQLAESYFKYDPYVRKLESHSFRQYNLHQSPSLMLLSWISVSLHHVSWRWQSAIEAVDKEICFSGEVVFMEDRTDLMADDPQFSLSKTYFWALQAYQLFEKTLLETIGTWKAFKEHSLPSLRDGRVDPTEWQTLVSDIDDAIAELDAKVQRIRTRIEEVRDLRTGLISASALFDSRTSVRQGENIRILTYITILFFPLSFVTSVFSMSFIGTDTKYAFAISLPAITLMAAILVFNLQNIVTAWSVGTERSSGWLRHLMRRHRREGWKEQAVRLHEDLAATKPPVTKARRRSSAWVYLLFLAEYMFVTVPVGEVAASLRWLGIIGKDRIPIPLSRKELDLLDQNDHLVVISKKKAERAEEIREKLNAVLKEEAKKEKKRRDGERNIILTLLLRSIDFVFTAGKWTLMTLIRFIRTLFVPLWLVLLGTEYLAVLFIFTITAWFRKDIPDDDTVVLLPKDSKENNSDSAWQKSSNALGFEIIIPPRRKQEEVEDPEVQHIRRVKTQLNGISTPSLSVASPKMRHDMVTETEVARDIGSGNGKRGASGGRNETPGQRKVDDYGDMMRVSRSSNEVTRKVERGARFARSGLKPELNIYQ